MGELDQTTIGSEEIKEEDKFIVFFLYDDEDQTVHVEEAEDIDFSRVFRHLTLGGSVYITHRRRPDTNIVSGTKKSERYKMIQLGL
jgi:hypothetical protein